MQYKNSNIFFKRQFYITYFYFMTHSLLPIVRKHNLTKKITLSINDQLITQQIGKINFAFTLYLAL